MQYLLLPWPLEWKPRRSGIILFIFNLRRLFHHYLEQDLLHSNCPEHILFTWLICFKEYQDVSGHKVRFIAILRFLQYFYTNDNKLEEHGVRKAGSNWQVWGSLCSSFAITLPRENGIFMCSPTSSSWLSAIPSLGLIQGFSSMERLSCLHTYNEVLLLWTSILVYGNPPICPVPVIV